jgi:hypothetical protein
MAVILRKGLNPSSLVPKITIQARLAYRSFHPAPTGDRFKICHKGREIKFKVVKMEPVGFGIVQPGAIIYGEGDPIERADDEGGLN